MDDIRSRHHPFTNALGEPIECGYCPDYTQWPCDAIREADRADAAEAALALYSRLVDVQHEDDGTISVSVHFMPGHIGAGTTLESAIIAAEDAGYSWLEAYRERVSHEGAARADAKALAERLRERSEMHHHANAMHFGEWTECGLVCAADRALTTYKEATE
jgi:hypothetical protein